MANAPEIVRSLNPRQVLVLLDALSQYIDSTQEVADDDQLDDKKREEAARNVDAATELQDQISSYVASGVF